jgi:hypothetical protein
VKRWAFQHEREIRLIAWANERPPDGVLTYDVNPHELIDQLMLDPRLSIDEAETLKAEIKARTGFGGPIKRSLLYAPPAWLNVLDTPSSTRLQPTARRSVLRRG